MYIDNLYCSERGFRRREWSGQGRFMPPGLFISRLDVFTKVAWPLLGVKYATKRLGVWRSYGR